MVHCAATSVPPSSSNSLALPHHYLLLGTACPSVERQTSQHAPASSNGARPYFSETSRSPSSHHRQSSVTHSRISSHPSETSRPTNWLGSSRRNGSFGSATRSSSSSFWLPWMSNLLPYPKHLARKHSLSPRMPQYNLTTSKWVRRSISQHPAHSPSNSTTFVQPPSLPCHHCVH